MHDLLAQLTSDLSPPERDRVGQVFLAQARGRVRNGDLLRQAIDLALQVQAARNPEQGTASMDNALIETLTQVADGLESLAATYAVTGSVASSVHGEPFASLDVDLIASASPQQAAKLAAALTPRFYAPEDMLADAAQRSTIANVVDNRTGLKVGLSFVGDDAFLRETLRRRVRSRIGSHPAEFWFVTPEDIILMKFVWRQDTQSAKQWENALGVARIRGVRMDWKYLFEQARVLLIEDDLVKLRDEAGI